MHVPDQLARLAALGLVLLLTSATPAPADTVVIQPFKGKDTFVMQNFPNRITGAHNARLRVEASLIDKRTRRAFVQFPLAGIPQGSTVTSAVIGLYAAVNANDPSLVHGLHRIVGPWQKGEVKWANQPPFLAAPSATALVGDGRGLKTFDVTADVQAAVNLCTADRGWLLKDQAETASNEGVAYISSAEKHPADIGNIPRLVVTFTPPECVTDADCQDTSLCTVNERCGAGGTCEIDPVVCDDGDPCTDDICDCGQGCRAQSICSDGLSCTTDTCNPTTLECTNTPVDDVCITECSTGTCVGDPDDADLDPITGCSVESTEPAGTPCSDGESCTTPDACNGTGTCLPGPKDCTLPGCGTSPVCAEQCDNCIDDNDDGLVDWRDPQCAPLASGGGAGIGDPTVRGKRLVRCQQGIRSASSRFANQLRARLQKCTQGVFLCLQQKPGDAGCLAKARARCVKQTAALQGGPSSLEDRLGKKLTKACGAQKPGLLPVVSGAHLCGATGLGFASNVATCQTPQSAALMAAVTATLADAHRCRTVQLFAADVPRADELLTAGGVDTSTLPCLATGAQGGNLGLGKPAPVVKAVVNCQRGIALAGARFVKQILDAEQRCTEAVARCVQTKPGDAKCLAKAQTTCRRLTGKLYGGPKSREAKLKATIARTCGTTTLGKAPRVALTDLQSVLGIGYDTSADDCAGLGISGLASIEDVSECLVRHHVCRADQLLTSQTPRAHELLTIGGAVQR